MALSDCVKCWDTPCSCGWNYRTWSQEVRIKQAAAVLGVQPAALAGVGTPSAHPMMDGPAQSEHKPSLPIDKLSSTFAEHRIALRGLVDATEDTLRTHPETDCCAVTRLRCKEAREVLGDVSKSPEKRVEPRGKPCTCDNCLGSSTSCRVDAGERLGDLWYCRKRAENGIDTGGSNKQFSRGSVRGRVAVSNGNIRIEGAITSSKRIKGLAMHPNTARALGQWLLSVTAESRVPEMGMTRAELLELLSALPDFVIDFDGHVPGDHALRLAERAGVPRSQEAWDAVKKRSALSSSEGTAVKSNPSNQRFDIKFDQADPIRRMPDNWRVIDMRTGRVATRFDPDNARMIRDALNAYLDNDGPAIKAAVEPFAVKHYSHDERPIIKGNGFDGLEIGEDREQAQGFVDWINNRLPLR